MSVPVEQLARWLHETACRLRNPAWDASGRPFSAWDDLSPDRRDDYRAVARELLEHPPDCLLCAPVVVEDRT